MPWNLVRCRLLDYKDLRRRILQLAERYTRYQNHITFISNCIKQQKVPKGFRLKFHCTIVKLEFDNTIKKCSLKWMRRSVSNHKRSILTMKTDFDKMHGEVNYFHSNRREALSREIERHEKHFHQILAIRRWKKYERDKIDGRKSNISSLINNSTENGNFQKKILAAK